MKNLGKTSGKPPENLGKTSGGPPVFRNAAFWKNPEIFLSKIGKLQQTSAKFRQNLRNVGKKQQKIQQFLTKILRLESGANALCRSRRELSNEYLLAKFGFDTVENELDFYFLIFLPSRDDSALCIPSALTRRLQFPTDTRYPLLKFEEQQNL